MEMSRLDKAINLVVIVVPPIGVVFAAVMLWNRGFDAIDLGLFLGFYVLTGFGITVGYHRLFTHKAFAAKPWVSNTLAVLGSMALEGPVSDWVADHRKHHAHTDVEGDPHSPHLGEGSGLRGLFHAHLGWIFHEEDRADSAKYAKDILADPSLSLISRLFPVLAILGVLLPGLLGYALHGFEIAGLLTGLLWGGLVRLFFLHHVTWSINSVCHFSGTRRFGLDDHSTNVYPLVRAARLGPRRAVARRRPGRGPARPSGLSPGRPGPGGGPSAHRRGVVTAGCHPPECPGRPRSPDGDRVVNLGEP